MFRVVIIDGVANETFDEESFSVHEAFFFTIETSSYYLILDRKSEVIGIIPVGYNLFFKVDEHYNLEDIDMENVLRLYNMGEEFKLLGTRSDENKVSLISSRDISEFRLIEDEPISIPFTNKAFDSDGVVVFKNISSLAESLNLDIRD